MGAAVCQASPTGHLKGLQESQMISCTSGEQAALAGSFWG